MFVIYVSRYETNTSICFDKFYNEQYISKTIICSVPT